jgi:hypothetical protein
VSLAEQVRQAIDDAVTRVLNTEAGVGVRPLVWYLDSRAAAGQIAVKGQAPLGYYPESEIPQVLAGWATALGLKQQEPAAYLAGVLTFAGRVDDVLVVVWGVVDENAWDTATGDLRTTIVEDAAGAEQ